MNGTKLRVKVKMLCHLMPFTCEFDFIVKIYHECLPGCCVDVLIVFCSAFQRSFATASTRTLCHSQCMCAWDRIFPAHKNALLLFACVCTLSKKWCHNARCYNCDVSYWN